MFIFSIKYIIVVSELISLFHFIEADDRPYLQTIFLDTVTFSKERIVSSLAGGGAPPLLWALVAKSKECCARRLKTTFCKESKQQT